MLAELYYTVLGSPGLQRVIAYTFCMLWLALILTCGETES